MASHGLESKLRSVRIEDMQMSISFKKLQFLDWGDSSQRWEGAMVVVEEKKIDEFTHQALLGRIVNRAFKEPAKRELGEDRQQVVIMGIGGDGVQYPLPGRGRSNPGNPQMNRQWR